MLSTSWEVGLLIFFHSKQCVSFRSDLTVINKLNSFPVHTFIAEAPEDSLSIISQGK